MKIHGSGRNYKWGEIHKKENKVSPNRLAQANSTNGSDCQNKNSCTSNKRLAIYDFRLSNKKNEPCKSQDIRIEKVEEAKQKVSLGYYQKNATLEQIASKILHLWGVDENNSSE
jgi:anti-sigma28 factor (negative regulator of flagellin synthesis)